MNKYIERLSNILSVVGFAHLLIWILLLVHVSLVLILFGLIYTEEKHQNALNSYYSGSELEDWYKWDIKIFEQTHKASEGTKYLWSIRYPGVKVEDGDYDINGAYVKKENKNFILANIIVSKYGKKPLDTLMKEYPYQYQLIVLIIIYSLNYLIVGNIRVFPWRRFKNK